MRRAPGTRTATSVASGMRAPVAASNTPLEPNAFSSSPSTRLGSAAARTMPAVSTTATSRIPWSRAACVTKAAINPRETIAICSSVRSSRTSAAWSCDPSAKRASGFLQSSVDDPAETRRAVGGGARDRLHLSLGDL